MAFNFKFVIAAVLLSAFSVFATPVAQSRGIAKRQLEPDDIARADLSLLFGWQLTGSHITETQDWAGCAGTGMSTKWTAIGLDIDYIKASLCNTSAPHAAADVVPYTIEYNTDLFVTQLLSSFTNTEALAHICGVIDFNMVSSFRLNDFKVVNAVCSGAGMQAKPRPEASLPWAPSAAVSAAKNTASILFANILAIGATTESDLSFLCAKVPDYIPCLNEEQLNGTVIQSRVCSITQPISTSDGIDLVTTWRTRYFITVIENISDSDDWLDWLCANIDPGLLTFNGLYGMAVQQQVCNDSKNSPGGIS